MSDHKTTIRYLGYRSLPDGGRGYDFSYVLSGGEATVTIDAASPFFRGPEQIAIQEAAGICYEMLRLRIQTLESNLPHRINLTAADVSQHRKPRKETGARR